MNYYTGMLFEVFASGSGFPLGNGGRYDGLLEEFGSKVGATGFGIRVDRLLETLSNETKEEENILVLFEDVLYVQALEKASSLRQSGVRVTLQNQSSVVDVKAFSANFTQVVLVGQEDSNE